MKLDTLVQTSKAVAASAGRLDKIARLAAFLKQLSADEIAVAIGFLTGWPRQGRIGVGWATVAEARETPPDDVADALGERRIAAGEAVRPPRALAHEELLLEEVPEDLLHEERVSLGLLVDGAGQGEVGLVERPA
jgi:DNA ligase-1